MRVLLLADVRGVGRKHEVKDVADGYARNFLIARTLAVPADQKGEAIKSAIDAKEQAEQARLHALAARLASLPLKFTLKTGQHKEVFGSISKRDIEQVLHAQGITEGVVVLDHPIKTTGAQKVTVDFGKGVKGVAQVSVDAA